jgi:hypothetical protein
MQARVKGEPTELFLLSKVATAHTLVSRVVNLLWPTAAYYKETSLLQKWKKARKCRTRISHPMWYSGHKEIM